MIIIIVSVLLFCLETMSYFQQGTRLTTLFIVDAICVTFFTIELMVRFSFCPDKVDFLKGIMNWIDFIAIVPFFVNVIRKHCFKTEKDLFYKAFQSIRVVRVFRIIKLSRHSIGLQILGHTLKASFRELLLLIFFLIIGIVIFSSLVYYCEKDERGTKFQNIPATFWWAVITMTTVGYGDMVPNTLPGKVSPIYSLKKYHTNYANMKIHTVVFHIRRVTLICSSLVGEW